MPPKRPPVPPVKNAAWPKNDIDRFVLARLEAEGLEPRPEADRITLARRLALDLTGLPPTPDPCAESLYGTSIAARGMTLLNPCGIHAGDSLALGHALPRRCVRAPDLPVDEAPTA